MLVELTTQVQYGLEFFALLAMISCYFFVTEGTTTSYLHGRPTTHGSTNADFALYLLPGSHI